MDFTSISSDSLCSLSESNPGTQVTFSYYGSLASLNLVNSSHLSCLLWPWHFKKVLVSEFLDCPAICCLFDELSWLDWSHTLWQEVPNLAILLSVSNCTTPGVHNVKADLDHSVGQGQQNNTCCLQNNTTVKLLFSPL